MNCTDPLCSQSRPCWACYRALYSSADVGIKPPRLTQPAEKAKRRCELLDHADYMDERVEQLEAQKAELVKALRPFANYAQTLGVKSLGDNCPITAEPSYISQVGDVTIRDLKNAQRALALAGARKDGETE